MRSVSIVNSRHVADLHISSSRAKHEKTPTLCFFATAFVACRLEGPRRCSAAALQLRRSHPPQQCSSCPSVMCIRVFVPSSVRSICSKDFCLESETVLSQRRLALCHRARWDAGHSLASGSLSAGLADDDSSTWQLLAASPTSLRICILATTIVTSTATTATTASPSTTRSEPQPALSCESRLG